jgi:hypothetical protein
MISKAALVLLLAVGCASIAGCTAGEEPPFQGSRSGADSLPSGTPALGVDATTTRYQGEADGYRVYLARPAESAGVCLVAVRLPQDASSACAASGGEVTLSTEGGTRIRFDKSGVSQDGAAQRLSRYVDFVHGSR